MPRYAYPREERALGRGRHADQLLLHPARRQAEGLGQGIPDPARGDQVGRDRRPRRRQPHGRQLLLPVARRAGQGRGPVRQVRPRLRRLLQGRRAARRLHPGDPARVAAEAARARALARGEGGDREDGLGRADGDAEEALRGAEEAPRGRQQDDRHRRHLAVRRLRLQPAGHPHRPGEGPQQERGQGLGPAPVQGLRRQPRARHAQHQGGAAAAAPLRPRGRRGGARPRRHDPARPRPMPAGSTSRWCPSGTTR